MTAEELYIPGSCALYSDRSTVCLQTERYFAEPSDKLGDGELLTEACHGEHHKTTSKLRTIPAGQHDGRIHRRRISFYFINQRMLKLSGLWGMMVRGLFRDIRRNDYQLHAFRRGPGQVDSRWRSGMLGLRGVCDQYRMEKARQLLLPGS